MDTFKSYSDIINLIVVENKSENGKKCQKVSEESILSARMPGFASGSSLCKSVIMEMFHVSGSHDKYCGECLINY